MADYTIRWCDECERKTMHRYPDDETPNEVLECAEHPPHHGDYPRG